MLLMKIFCLTLMISQQRKYFKLRRRSTKGIAGWKFGLAVSQRRFKLKTTFYRGLKLMVNNNVYTIYYLGNFRLQTIIQNKKLTIWLYKNYGDPKQFFFGIYRVSRETWQLVNSLNVFFHNLVSCLIPKTIIKILCRSHILVKLISK